MSKYALPAYVIGIDTGKNTGVALRCENDLVAIFTSPIHRAMDFVRFVVENNIDRTIRVYVEDARKNKIPRHVAQKLAGKDGAEARSQGVGAVKAHAMIWEDFLKDLQKEYGNVEIFFISAINAAKKLSEDKVKFIYNIEGKLHSYCKFPYPKLKFTKQSASNHARDAATIAAFHN